MAFWDRLAGTAEPRIPVHYLYGVMGELERGKITRADAVTQLQLDPAEAVEMDALLAKIVYPRDAMSLGGFTTLSNVGSAYDTGTGAAHGLGIVGIQTAGITQIIFGVKVNKIGTGTQSWQFWNETEGSEIAVIDDAGAQGIKLLQVTRDFSPALGAGLKVCRVRAKSTVAADDPIYLGATVSLRRVDALTPDELQQVAMGTEVAGSPYYQNPAALKARLGVV